MPSGELDAFLRDFLLQEGVSTVVVGVPKTLAGEVGFQARRVLGTLSHLRERFPGVEFVEWDERLTTRVAGLGTAGGAGGHRKKKRRGATTERVDHIAAARMLDEYLRYRERN